MATYTVAPPFIAFLRVLKREQEREGLSDTAMARKCGVSGSYFSLVFNEWRSPGAKFLLGAFQAYPHHHVEPNDDVEPPACVACDLAAALGGPSVEEMPPEFEPQPPRLLTRPASVQPLREELPA